MRVYLIAAPEDEAEAEKLAEHLNRFGVFIRAEYGRMSYPPAHTGEYTLALWSRNAMMSSRQMMLTNRAIDAWENGQLVMARLEHGLNPRGLGDLEMVDLTFPAARQHRYHDVLNALRAMEDDRRAALREQELAEAKQHAASMRASADVDMAMSAPAGAAPDLAPQAPSQSRRAASAPASATKSSGAPVRLISILIIMAVGIGGAFWVMNTMSGSDRAAMPEPVAVEEPAVMAEPGPSLEEDPDYGPPSGSVRETPSTRSLSNGSPVITAQSQNPDSLPRIRGEITTLQDAIDFEQRALVDMEATPETPPETLIRQRQIITDLDRDLTEKIRTEAVLSDRFEASAATPPPAEPTLLGRLRQANGPVLWAAAAGLVLLFFIMLTMRRKTPTKTGAPSPADTDDAPTETVAAPEPVAPPMPVLDDGHDAFVSYSHANAETVLPIVQSIEEDGITVWIDRDEMRAGQNWAGQIVRAIKSADRFCLMCSAQAFESDHVRREVYLADKYGKKMVPIRLDATEMPEDIEYFLIGRQWIDLFEVAEEDRMKAIKALLAESEN
ncbi:MAG: TIR domain-containing protein [Pseudomonadota bacterium]